jgi:fatty acid desaturase
MLGPLPRLYRSLVVAAALLVFIGGGIVLAQLLPLPFGGVVVGSATGLLIAFVLVHDFHHRRAQPSRALRRHP